MSCKWKSYSRNEIPSLVAKVRWVNLIYSLGFTLGIVCILIWAIFQNHCRAKKCLLPLVNEWKTLLSHFFNLLELNNPSNIFYNVFLRKMKKLPFISEPKLPRKLRAPDYSINDHFGSSCVKSVQIRSYLWSVFFCIRTWNNSVFGHFSRSSSNKQSNAYHPNTPLDYYRVIYYEALDSLITSLKERFDQPRFIKLKKFNKIEYPRWCWSASCWTSRC